MKRRRDNGYPWTGPRGSEDLFTRSAITGLVVAFALAALPATAGAAVTTASGSGYREWTVTQLVRDMYAPNANHGFTVRDAGVNGQLPQDFHSREKGTDNPPRLVITFGT
jgi:hypothetical protein